MFLITKLPHGSSAPGAGHFICEHCECEWSATQEDMFFDYNSDTRLSRCPYCNKVAKIEFKSTKVDTSR